MKDIAYPNQQTDMEIPHGSKDHVILPDTVKIPFDLDIESTDKARSLWRMQQGTGKKKVLMLGLKEIDTINNSYLLYLWHVQGPLSKQKRTWKEVT